MMDLKFTESRIPSTTANTLEKVVGGTRYTCRISGLPARGGPIGRVF